MQAKPSLSLYSFSEMWSPGFFVALFGIAVLYFLLIRKWRHHFAESAPVPKSKQFYFVSALTLYYIVWGSPLKVLGEYSFSMHMVSMTIAYLAVMPLFLLGIPKWFWKPIMHKPFLRKGLRFFTQPLLAVVLFNMLFSFAHFPSLFNWYAQYAVTMELVHYFIMIFAFFMWWAVLTPLPELRELSYLKKFGLILVDGALLTPACMLLAFSSHLVYEPYFNVQQVLWLKTWFPQQILDQQASGVFMKFIQEICYITAMSLVVFKWATTERKKQKDEDPFAASPMSQMMRPRENEN